MIVGLGLDLVDVARLRGVRHRHGQRFDRRVFTPGELGYCLGRSEPDAPLAARFAAKEAGMKALGSGWGAGVAWRDLEVLAERGRPPRLRLSGRAAELAAALGVDANHLTLTHDGGVAAAVVVLESRREGWR